MWTASVQATCSRQLGHVGMGSMGADDVHVGNNTWTLANACAFFVQVSLYILHTNCPFPVLARLDVKRQNWDLLMVFFWYSCMSFVLAVDTLLTRFYAFTVHLEILHFNGFLGWVPEIGPFWQRLQVCSVFRQVSLNIHYQAPSPHPLCTNHQQYSHIRSTKVSPFLFLVSSSTSNFLKSSPLSSWVYASMVPLGTALYCRIFSESGHVWVFWSGFHIHAFMPSLPHDHLCILQLDRKQSIQEPTGCSSLLVFPRSKPKKHYPLITHHLSGI